MNAYNRQTILNSFTSGFKSRSGLPDPGPNTRLDPNIKRDSLWADVQYTLSTPQPLVVVVIGVERVWSCYVVMQMFEESWKRRIDIDVGACHSDSDGFVYHTLALVPEESPLHDEEPLMSYGLLLPNLWSDEGGTQFAIIDKEWRFIDQSGCWTHCSK